MKEGREERKNVEKNVERKVERKERWELESNNMNIETSLITA
jgi:hypothetical protein